MWIAAIVGSLVLAAFALAAWLRRGESRPDRPGERTCATFRAPSGPEPADGDPLGRELAIAIQALLRDQNGSADEPSLGDGRGWAFATRDAYMELIATEAQPEGDHGWAITIADRSSGGPGPIAVARALDAALRRVEGVRSVRWHRRESFDPWELDGGHEHPVDDPGPTYRS